MRRTTADLGKRIAVLMAVIIGFALVPALAQDKSEATATLKPMAPQIDPNADIGHKNKPLQGTVQHTEDFSPVSPKPSKPMKANVSGGGLLGRLRGDAKTAPQDQLKGRANN